MPSFTSAAIIFNPNSTGNAEEQAEELQAALSEAFPDIPITLLPTAHAGHAVELAYEAAKSLEHSGSPLIISASGDGGYNEVINGALKAQDEGANPICAVLPSGNANDHARTMQDRPLLDIIKKDSVTQLDVLKLETTPEKGPKATRYAHSYIGLGLSPTVAVELNKHTLNSLMEAWIVLKTFWTVRPVVIRTGDKTLRLDSLICGIIPEMSKVLTISDEAKPDDGLFELTTFEHNKKLKLLLRIFKGVFSTLEAKSRLHDYECTLLSPAPIQLDGEVMKLGRNTLIKISICPRALRTFV